MTDLKGNTLTGEIIGAAIAVHRALGPGLLESAYEACLVKELGDRGIQVERQKTLPVTDKGVRIDCGYRMDLVVEGAVVVELKTVERVQSVHQAQLLSYLRLSDLPIGLLINFNVTQLVTGIRRVVLDHAEEISAVSAFPMSESTDLNSR